MGRDVTQSPAIALGLALLSIPVLFLAPAWSDIVGKSRDSLQEIQLESVRMQAVHISHQLSALQQLSAYLAEDPSELQSRIWSPVMPKVGFSEGVHVAVVDSTQNTLFDTLPGSSCVVGGFPREAGTRMCDLPPLRVATTTVAKTGERVTVLQETAALSPMLQSPWAWVVDRDGIIAAHADPTQVGTDPFASGQGGPALRSMLVRMAGGESGTAAYRWTSGEGRQTRLAAFAPVPGAPNGWAIATSTAETAAVGPLQGARRRLGIAGLAVLLLAVGFSGLLWFSERRRRRLEATRAEERLRLTEAAAHSERLALIGTLTAGVAHDIRSPLTAMVSLSDLLEEAEEDEREELLCDLRDAVDTMRAIADDLTGFSRGDSSRAGCPHKAIDLAVRMVQARFRGKRQLTVDLGDMPEVTLDSRRLSQALMNLCVNAVQAGATEVRLSGRTETDGCVILIEDNGPGIPAELGARIFEPFLTTKVEGEGTGLGLYLVRNFIEEAEGQITLEHSSLGGAAFRIQLPPAHAATTEPSADPGPGATIAAR